jgi:transposase InsO family protein
LSRRGVVEVIHGFSFATDGALDQQLRSYIPYYNRVRSHSGLGYYTPFDYETRGA